MTGRRVVAGSATLVAVLLLAVVLVLVAQPSTGLAGRWLGPDGRTLPDGSLPPHLLLTVRTVRGAEHCDAEGVVFLELTWPPGSSVSSGDPDAMEAVRSYVRDPDRTVVGDAAVSYDADAAIPSTAIDTGFHRWGNQLAVDPAGDAYITRPSGRTERWPRFDDQGCD